MTKKDYQRIADAILEARRGLSSIANEKTGSATDLFEFAISWAIRELSDTLLEENPRFDPERFRDTCLKKVQ